MAVCGQCEHPVRAGITPAKSGTATADPGRGGSCEACRRPETPQAGTAFGTAGNGPKAARMCLITPDGVSTVEFALEPSVGLRCTLEEGAAALALNRWLYDADPSRCVELQIAFLQFEYNPGRESFATEEIRMLRALLAEQRGTARWNDALAGLLARMEACEAEL